MLLPSLAAKTNGGFLETKEPTCVVLGLKPPPDPSFPMQLWRGVF